MQVMDSFDGEDFILCLHHVVKIAVIFISAVLKFPIGLSSENTVDIIQDYRVES